MEDELLTRVPSVMRYVSPKFKLRVDADLARGSPLYSLAIDGVSVVAALRQVTWHFAVALDESFLLESECATELVALLAPLTGTPPMLSPRESWPSDATLRLHTRARAGSLMEADPELQVTFRANDLTAPLRRMLGGIGQEVRADVRAAIEEEIEIIRSLDGFSGPAAALFERMRLHMECGAMLARGQLIEATMRRAQESLQCLYSEDPLVRQRADEFSSWLMQHQCAGEHATESDIEERGTGRAVHRRRVH